jgi:hypothetical protein
MYDKPFFINAPVSNNAFSFKKRPGARLYVAALKEGSINDILPGTETVFEDFEEDSNGTILRSRAGLRNFVKITRHKKPNDNNDQKESAIPVYVFDNHNHAFAFWHLEMARGLIKKGCVIVHVDQHKDSREPEFYLSPADAIEPAKVFRYTNETLNVGNFMLAALKTGLAERIVNVDSEASMTSFALPPGRDIILDVDLDFFAPELDYIGNEKKFAFIKQVAELAKLITIATSPFFIDQDLAMACLRRIAKDLNL